MDRPKCGSIGRLRSIDLFELKRPTLVSSPWTGTTG
jgi:hypothetical protein